METVAAEPDRGSERTLETFLSGMETAGKKLRWDSRLVP